MLEARSVIERLPFLQFLPPASRSLFLENLTPVSFPYGSIIVREGDASDALYVLTTGRVRVVKHDRNGQEKTLKILAPGETFGGEGLLKGERRSATIQACDHVQGLKIDGSMFSTILGKEPQLRAYFERKAEQTGLQDFLRLNSPFSEISADALAVMTNELQVILVEEGYLLIRQGEEPGPMYVVLEGRLRVYVEVDGHREHQRDLGAGDVFGEMSTFRRIQRTASVEAASSCRLARVAPETFWKLVNHFPGFKSQIETNMCWHGWVPV